MKDIEQIIRRITDSSEAVRNNNLSEIERDILLEDIRRLYTIVKGSESVTNPVIPYREESIDPPSVSQQVTIAEPAPVVKEEPFFVIDDKPMDVAPVVQEIKKPEYMAPEIETTIAENVIKEVGHLAPPEEPAVTIIPKSVKEETKSKPILNEGFGAGEERSLNERLSGPKRTALNDNIGGKDLKSMIDFNKQYVLTNELFKGDSQAFHAAIRRINESPTIEAAFDYIKTDLLPIYKWNGEMQSARLFDKLVRQKFGI